MKICMQHNTGNLFRIMLHLFQLTMKFRKQIAVILDPRSAILSDGQFAVRFQEFR
jgi:hypothetical protein